MDNKIKNIKVRGPQKPRLGNVCTGFGLETICTFKYTNLRKGRKAILSQINKLLLSKQDGWIHIRNPESRGRYGYQKYWDIRVGGHFE